MTAPADPQGARSAGNHRSWLFVPGNRPDRFDKALASGADAVIVDLEDAVAPPDKTHARDEVARLLAGHDAFVRINGADTEWYADDLAALGRRPGLAGIILPKATTAADVADVAARTAPGVAIVALVETAAGLHNAGAIAASSHTTRLAFGSIDFALDIGADLDDTTLLYARSALVVASRAAGLPGPVDGVTTALDDPAVAAADARRAHRLGFTGKLCVHPRQVAAVNEAFSYSPETVAWARRVVEAAEHAGGAAVRVDGQMIDRPRLELAHRILAVSQPGRQA